MLSAAAMRLAAIEVLCPHAAIEAGSGYPTLARDVVLDSRAVALDDIDMSARHTPVLSLFTAEADVRLAAPPAAVTDTGAQAVLEVVAELAVVANDGDGEFADAMQGDDADARLTLEALCAQVRRMLTVSEAGILFRHIVKSVDRIEVVPFAFPELGMRWQRVMMRFHCSIADDEFPAEGGLPPRVARLQAALPDGSYTKARLAALAAEFAAMIPPPLQSAEFETGPDVTGGVDFTG